MRASHSTFFPKRLVWKKGKRLTLLSLSFTIKPIASQMGSWKRKTLDENKGSLNKV